MKIAFLDRDGTLNKDYDDEKWKEVKEPEILSGTINGLKYLKEKGYKFIIITNQYLIGEGYITYSDYMDFTLRLKEKLKNEDIDILDTFCCPHSRREFCQCHKPLTGLVVKAVEKYPQIDLESSIYIGDSLSDYYLAKKMKLKFYPIKLDLQNRIENIDDIKKYI